MAGAAPGPGRRLARWWAAAQAAWLRHRLARGDDDPARLTDTIARLAAALSAAGQGARLPGLLAARPDTGLATLRGLAEGLTLATLPGQRAAFMAAVRAHAARPETPPARFLPAEHLAPLLRGRGLDAEARALLAARKFAGVDADGIARTGEAGEGGAGEGGEAGASLAATARRLAPSVVLPAALAARLFAARRGRERTEAEWRAGLCLGIAADHLVCDAGLAGLVRRGTPPPWIATDILGEAEAARAAFGFAAGRGLLLATFHAGHLGMVRWLFRQAFRDGVTLGLGETEREEGALRRVSVREDPRATLFAALRLLQDGRMLLIAPDGPCGEARLPVTILGRPFSIGEGAAFLVFDSGAASAFFTFRFDGARFVPHVVPGPEPAPRETYRDFRIRWADFYAGEIDAIFTGPPESIAFRLPWYERLLRGH